MKVHVVILRLSIFFGLLSGSVHDALGATLATPGVPDLQAASDSGTWNNDDLTNDTTPTFDITCETGATVQLREGAILLGSGVCAAGRISLTSVALLNGVHSVAARQIMGASTSAQSAALPLFIDTSLPPAPQAPVLTTASDTGPSNSDRITSDNTPTVTLICDAGSVVQLREGTAVLASSDCTGFVALTTGVLADGVHNLVARQIDVFGNASAVSAALSVTIDTIAPGVSGIPDLTPASDSGKSNSDNITNIKTPVFTVACGNGNTVSLQNGAAVLGSGTCSSLNTVSIASSMLTDGSHTIKSRQTDRAGNTSAESSGLVVTIDSVGNAPGVPDLLPLSDTGLSNTDNITNDTTPSFIIACENAAVVQLRSGTAVIGSGTCAFGMVTITSGTLGQGSREISASQTDAVGNVSFSATTRLVIETSAPLAPGAPDLQAASDDGTSNTDNRTSISTPTFDVSCVANASVELREGAVILGSGLCVPDAFGKFGTASIKTAFLARGSHTIVARQTSPAGNLSPFSTALAVAIEGGNPSAPATPDLSTASDSGASNSDNITSFKTPVFTVPCDSFTFTMRLLASPSTVLGSGSCVTGTASITSSILADGVYNITAQQISPDGQSGPHSESALTVIIDSSEPAPGTPDLQADSDSGSSNSDNITNVSTPTFNVACASGNTVELRNGTLRLGSAPCADGMANITSSPLSAGIQRISARQIDVAGNTSSDSAALTVTIDTTPSMSGTPDLKATSDSGSSALDNVTNISTPEFSITCGTSGDTVELVEGTTVLGAGVCASGVVSISSSVLSDGVHNLSSRERTLSGTLSANSPALTVTIDTISPAAPAVPDLQTASDTGASNSDNLTNISQPVFDVLCVGEQSPVHLREGTVHLGAGICINGVASIATSVLANGSHAISARQFDRAGNASAISDSLAIMIDVTTLAAPGTPDLQSDSDSGISATDDVTGDNSPTVSLSCVDATTVHLLDGQSPVGSAVCSAGTVSITTSILMDGAHNLAATQVDSFGNASPRGASLRIVIDTLQPAAPVISSPANGATIATGSFTISGTAAVSTVSIFDNGALVGMVASDSLGQWSFAPSTPFADGVHRFSAQATDAAGNTGSSSAELKVTVDTRIPSNNDNDGFVSSPAVIKWNTYLKQWNFLELVAKGPSPLVITAETYNLNSIRIATDSILLSGDSEFDYDVNNAIRTACERPVPSAGCTGLSDADGDGLVDSYGVTVLRFSLPEGSRLVGRMTNYRPAINSNSFDFAFPRELRQTLRGKSYAVANTYDPQNLGFAVPNFGELIHIGNAAKAAAGDFVNPGRYTVNLYDSLGGLKLSMRIPADNQSGIKAFGEVDFPAGNQITHPQTGKSVESIYLVEVIPDDVLAEYQFSVSRYSANAAAGQLPSSYNYALAVPGRQGAKTALYAPITNEAFSCGTVTNWVEVANVTSAAQPGVVTFRNSQGVIVGSTATMFTGKGQLHLNASALLAAGDIGSVEISGSTPGTFVVQSMVYIHSCDENRVDTAYVSLAREAGSAVQNGTINTYLGMSDTIRSWSTSRSSSVLSLLLEPMGGQAISNQRMLPAYGADSVLANGAGGLGFPGNQYGALRIDGGGANRFLAQVLRFRTQARNGKAHIDFVVPSELR